MNKTESELEFVSRRFDRDATSFDAIYSDDETGFYKWFNRNFRKPIYERFDLAFEGMGDLCDKTVIDVGCGSGVYLTNIVLKGAKHAVGVDFSAEMLKLAANKINKIDDENVCELQHGNFLEMNYSEPFNFSLAMGVFDYLPDPIQFMKKLKAVTKDKVIASFPGHSAVRQPLRKLRYILTSRGRVYFYSQADIEKIVQSVGFQSYQLIPIQTGSGFVLVATP